MGLASVRGMAAALSTAALVALPAGASADSFGQIARFGSAGKAPGQFTVSPTETAGFGIDPSDNSLYVVDEPTARENEFRLQKFSTTAAGQISFVAQTRFTTRTKAPSIVEGVAVDPAMHRAYVLTATERSKPGLPDAFDEAAAKLFAFSTEQSGETLVPAPGTTKGGVLASNAAFRPMGRKYGESLLEPAGIAVEPISATEDNVIVLGDIDAGETDSRGVLVHHAALWWVSSSGSVERRYVDQSDVLEDEADSPVVAGGKVYVEGEEGIFEIPFDPGQPPREVIGESVDPGFYEGFNEPIFLTPPVAQDFLGGGLAAAPDGTLWAAASIKNADNNENFRPGTVSWSPSGRLTGWTGGQSSGACSLSIQGTALIAAGREFAPGSGPAVFMFDTDPRAPGIVQFGAGGSGCPPASAGSVVATEHEGTEKAGEPVPAGTEQEFSAPLTQADAVSSEWSFGDGSPPVVVNEAQARGARATHLYAEAGTYEITVTIHTDDLATPTLTAHGTIEVGP
jgi:hypothetical protein